MKFLCRLKINENFLCTSKTPLYKEVIVAHSLHWIFKNSLSLILVLTLLPRWCSTSNLCPAATPPPQCFLSGFLLVSATSENPHFSSTQLIVYGHHEVVGMLFSLWSIMGYHLFSLSPFYFSYNFLSKGGHCVKSHLCLRVGPWERLGYVGRWATLKFESSWIPEAAIRLICRYPTCIIWSSTIHLP